MGDQKIARDFSKDLLVVFLSSKPAEGGKAQPDYFDAADLVTVQLWC